MMHRVWPKGSDLRSDGRNCPAWVQIPLMLLLKYNFYNIISLALSSNRIGRWSLKPVMWVRVPLVPFITSIPERSKWAVSSTVAVVLRGFESHCW